MLLINWIFWTTVVGCWCGCSLCLEQGADLHMAQLIPLPLTVSCFTKIQIGFTFLVPAHLCSPGKSATERMCIFEQPVSTIQIQGSAHSNKFQFTIFIRPWFTNVTKQHFVHVLSSSKTLSVTELFLVKCCRHKVARSSHSLYRNINWKEQHKSRHQATLKMTLLRHMYACTDERIAQKAQCSSPVYQQRHRKNPTIHFRSHSTTKTLLIQTWHQRRARCNEEHHPMAMIVK